MERHEEALASYQDAFTLFRQVGDTPHQAICLINIANALYAAGRHEESLASLRESLGVYRQADGTEQDQVDCLNLIGDLLNHMGRHKEAQDAYQQAQDHHR